MLKILVLAVSPLCLMGVPLLTEAQTLSNPTFDAALNPWVGDDVTVGCQTETLGSEVWDTMDHTGMPGSGSMALTTTVNNAGLSVAVAYSECLSVVPNSRYRLSGYFYPAIAGTVDLGFVGLMLFTNDTCACDYETAPSKGSSIADGTWTKVEGNSIFAPEEVRSGRFMIQLVRNTLDGVTGTVYFDDASIELREFYADGFESGDTAGWSMAVP